MRSVAFIWDPFDNKFPWHVFGYYNFKDGSLLINAGFPGHRSSSGYLDGGQGQLTDGIRSSMQITETSNWIGWQRQESQDSVDVHFIFDTQRNFSSVSIHSSNIFTRDIRVPRQIEVFFRSDADSSQVPQEPLVFSYMRDSLLEYPRDVIVDLQGRCAQMIRMVLYFDADWILIDEVQFESGKTVWKPAST